MNLHLLVLHKDFVCLFEFVSQGVTLDVLFFYFKPTKAMYFIGNFQGRNFQEARLLLAFCTHWLSQSYIDTDQNGSSIYISKVHKNR